MYRLGLLILPEFSQLGLAAAIEPLFVANWLAGERRFDWRIVSADGMPVRASNGTLTAVDGALPAAGGCASIFVLASFDPHTVARSAAVTTWLRRMARAGAEIGGIENGTIVLAASGLLDGHEAALHWDNLAGFQERYPKVRAVDALFVRGERRLTCAGAASVLDMMVAWIGWQGAPDLATETAAHLLLQGPRPGAALQRQPDRPPADRPDPVVEAARAVMAAQLEEALPCGEIARRVGLSLRQVERRFQRATGGSLVQAYLTLRLARAHRLLQQTELSVTAVAMACGFTSPTYFARLYRHRFGCPPSGDRRQLVAAPVLRGPGNFSNS